MKGTSKKQLQPMDLWKRWKIDKDPSANKQLIEHYLPLVHFVTNRFRIGLPQNISKDDLTSYGIIGLIDAIEKFDIERGLQFETYASWRIRGAMVDHLRQGDWVPRSVREKAKKVEEAYQVLEQRYLRTVTDAEMCEYLNIDESEFQQLIQDIGVTTICSLEDPIKEDETETRNSIIVDPNAKNPESTVNEQYMKESLAQAIDRLTEKERLVVSLYYYEELSLSEIAEVMALTPSRISQLHSKAILKLRGTLQKDKQMLMNDH